MADREDNEPGRPTISGLDLMKEASGFAGDDGLPWDAVARAAAYLQRAGYIEWLYEPWPNDPAEPRTELIDQRLFQRMRDIGVTAPGRTQLTQQHSRDDLQSATGAEAPFWHVIVVPVNAKRKEGWREAIATDKNRAWVEQRVLGPRRRGESIAIGGRIFDWADVEQLKITNSDESAADAIPRIEAEWAQSGAIAGGDPEWKAAHSANDMTDDLIDGPPGTATEDGPASTRVNRKAVMVVYGRDSEARRAMFEFLHALHLEPLEWSKLIEGTGKATPYIGEVLEKAFEAAAAVVVLLTPDDEARLREPFQERDDQEHERELTPQARPNVLFEAGMAFGIHANRTVLVELGKIRPFSDVGGRHAVRLNGTAAPLREIARRLATAGCEVDESGDDWATPDRFPER